MAGKYKAVGWNRQKKIYDATLLGALAVTMGGYGAATALFRPGYPVETFVLRATALSAVLLLHVILVIGPLSRLDRRFLPLLYNRRHLGVAMCCLAVTHALFAGAYYHGRGVTNFVLGVFTAYGAGGGGLAHVPFEPVGAAALIIIFLMAATSHDFWLRVLGASYWKSLHALVYLAYGAAIAHVALGVLQDERHPIYVVLLACGVAAVLSLHLAAHYKESRIDRRRQAAEADGYVFVCAVEGLREGHGKAVRVGDERRAIFRHNDRIYALSNVCRHQGGPVGEGRILDGCITCPWHGWQYLPDTGTSPPPFHEVIETYPVRVVDGRVYVHPMANPSEHKCAGAAVTAEDRTNVG